MRIAVAFFGAVLALVGISQPASAEPVVALSDDAVPAQMDMTAAADISWLLNGNSFKCALAQGGADNTPAVQYQCLNFADQKWDLVPAGAGQFQFRNVNSGKCLLIRGGDNGAPAVQYTCLNFADQKWEFFSFPNSPGWYWVRNVNSRKCLIVQGGSDGTQLTQFDCVSFVDQAWSRITL